MSWVKRRGEPPSASEGRTGVPFYNPNQHITPQPLQQQPFQNTTGSHSTQSQYPPANWYNPTQQIPHQTNYQLNQGVSQHPPGSYWQDQSHAYNQPSLQSTPYNSNLLPQGNNSNANQFMNSYHQQQPQPTENQQYYQNSNLTNIVQPPPNQNFFQPQQQNYQNPGTHYYPNNQRTPIPSNTENLPDQNFVSSQGNMNSSDPWNWGWGDESNAGATQTNMNKNDNTVSQSFSNIEDSFAVHDDSWNWTVDDSNSSSSASNSYNKTDQKQKNTLPISNKSDGFKNVALQQQSEFKNEQAQQSIVFEKVSPEAAAKHRGSSQQYPAEESSMKYETPREECINNNSPQQIQSNVVGTVGQRTQSDTLTPQWSIESQVSQDSSDDPLQTTSESDNKSNKLSRSSTTSQCPSLPNAQEYEIQHNHPFESYSEEKHTQQELTYPDYHQNQYTEESIQSQISEVSHAIENLVLQQENKEIVAPEVSNFENIDSNNQFTQPSNNTPSSSALQDLSSPPLMSYKNSIPLHKNETNSQMPPKNVTPPLMPPKNAPSPIMPAKNATPPLMPLKNTTPPLLPPVKNTASTSASSLDVAPPLIPPKNNLEGPNNINPYKRVSNKNTVQVSSRSANQVYATRNLNSQDNLNNQNFIPGLNQVPENRSHLEVNLETVPDNVERPDQIPSDLLRQNNGRKINTLSHTQQWPPVENLEVAPKNDRNQYLETGQLSDSDLPDYQQNDFSVETNTEEPPPGLRRMVLGRTENESILPSNVSSEPRILTGLDRVVDGQPENVVNSQNITSISHSTSERNDELPVGLHRMVPGESSSPESNSRWINNTQNNFFRSANFDDDDTEAELQNIENNISMLPSQRSETIGADTPPSLLSQIGDSSINRNSAIGRDSTTPDIRETNVDGADTQSDSAPPTSNDVPTRIAHQKNESISAQSTIRSQTDGENTTDNALGPNKESSTGRGRPRTDSSEDDREVRESSIDRRRNKSPGRYDKDRKYYDRRDRESPDRYWDRKSDRRRRDRDRYYDDETDYYSDKDKRDRRPRDTRSRDEYENLRMSNNSRQRGADYYRTYHGSRREVERGDKSRSDRERDRMVRNDYERDPRRDDYYYGRYEDDYYGRESRSSRPSSRSDSNYRDRVDPRDHRKMRDFYSPYYQGYGYDPSNPYYAVQYQQYQYYENLRRTNPTAYAEWYRKYMQSVGHIATNSINDSQVYRSHDDKASVHSGRSSTNDELRKERMLDHTDSSLNLEDTQTSLQRLTPAKFSTAHVKANISSGHFIRILPHYPIDGQPPIVEVLDLQHLLADDPEQQELLEFPGPLIKGVTHKKTLIEYCDNKIKKALCGPAFNDRESYILMWELLILLLRQNGVVVGTDIAELLMKNSTSAPAPVVHSRRASVGSSICSLPEEMPSCDGTRDDNTTASISHSKSTLSEAYITDKFREYLIYGSGKEALEWAMKHGLWGHALFLASKLDKRTYANVMMRFANGLTLNDPLQTLYQLLSGRLPAAVTCVSDEKWGDWKPHLAMILSNTSQRIDLDRKAITTLGDTLLSRGSIYAAHFCYLMAQTGFGDYGTKSGRLVLLGSSHQKSFKEFATNEAIIMTEIYEYACSLNDTTFNIPEFQIYKYLMANRLAERGFLERALLYTERVGLVIAQNPTRYSPSLANQIVNLAERLRSRDPAALADLQLDPNDSDGENNIPSNIAWISNLKSILSDYDMGLLTQEVRSMSNLASSELDIVNSITPPTDQSQQQTLTAPNLVPEQQTYDQQSWVQQQSTIPQQILQHDSQQQQQFYQPDFSQQHQHQQQSSWSGDQHSTQQQWQQQSEQQQQQQHTIAANQTTQHSISGGGLDYEPQDQQNQYWNQQQWGTDNHMNLQNDVQQNKDNTYWGATDNKEDVAAMRMPQITMPNSTSSYGYDDDDQMQTVQSTQTGQNQKNSQTTAASNQKKNKQTSSSGGSGWFGGIWNKLSLRPKNQMILPDDKNPTIVWDSEKKKWVNLDEDGSEESNNIKPPPRMSDLMPTTLPPTAITQKIPQPNNENKIPSHQNMPPFPTTNHTATNSTYNNNNDMNLNANENTKNAPPVPNMFKMQRGRGLKKAYVDVFNPGGTKAPSSLPPASVLGMNPIPQANTQLNYFVPASTNDPNAPVDFISNPSGVDLSAEQDNSQMNGPGPLMYNPNQFSN